MQKKKISKKTMAKKTVARKSCAKTTRRARGTSSAVLTREDSSTLFQKIQERAYFIWLEKGSPNNSALENWLEAERQIRQETKKLR